MTDLAAACVLFVIVTGGLGLPLTKTLVELHGGRLQIASALGSGTTVRVVFPRERILSGDASG